MHVHKKNQRHGLISIRVRSLTTAASVTVLMLAFVAANNPSVNNASNLRRRPVKPKVVGGSPAAKGEYPSFASGNGCGGTLISHDLVLTAAHCKGVFSTSGIVHIGGIELDGSDSEIVPVTREIPHIDFDDFTMENDIMIVKLSCSSRSNVQKLNFNDTTPEVGSTLTAVGFGYKDEFAGEQPKILQEVQVLTISNAVCTSQYRYDYEIFKDQMICAGESMGGKDTCQGDSGGPLMTVDGYQVGITSFGIGCARPGKPGIYTRVSTYETWIKGVISIFSKKNRTYC